jgi:sec-independent protein translocase protein TatC
MPSDPFEHTAMPLGDHLDELRRRIVLGLLGIVPVFVAGLVFGKTILAFVTQPLRDALAKEGLPLSMQTTGPLEGFMAYLKIALLLSLIIGAPWLIYQAWRFVAPGLYASERRFVNLLAPLSVAMSVFGLAFVYYVVIPMMLMFFVHFNATLIQRTPATAAMPAGVVLPSFPTLEADPESPEPGSMWINRPLQEVRVAVAMPPAADGTPTPPRVLGMRLTGDSLVSQEYRISEYLSLVIQFAGVFALTFQTPVVVLLIGWSGLVRVESMRKYRRYVIFGVACVSAVVTPPDALSMFLLGVPLYLLYELGVLMLAMFPASRVAGAMGEDDARAAEAEPTEPGDRKE